MTTNHLNNQKDSLAKLQRVCIYSNTKHNLKLFVLFFFNTKISSRLKILKVKQNQNTSQKYEFI